MILAPLAVVVNGPHWIHEFLPSLVTSIQTDPMAPAPQVLELVLRTPQPIALPPTLPVCISYEATAHSLPPKLAITAPAPAPATPRPLRLSGMSVKPFAPPVQSDATA